jgi:tight adherence protein B
MDFLALVGALFIMVAIIAGTFGFGRATIAPRQGMERRLGRMIGESTGMEAVIPMQSPLRSHREEMPLIGPLIQDRQWRNDLVMALERGDIRLSASEFVAMRLILAALGLTIGVGIIGGIVGIIFGLALAAAGYKLPALYLARAQAKRVQRLNSQLPDTLTMLANSLKAGFGILQSMELAAREIAHPMSTELRHTLYDVNIGVPTDKALEALAERSGSADLDIVVTAVLIQQSTGGNLAEILDTVANTMRERIRIRGEIKTLTTQQVMTGFIIGGLPIFIGGAVTLLNPSYIGPLFTTLPGQVMLGACAVFQVFGIIVIKRILAIEV